MVRLGLRGDRGIDGVARFGAAGDGLGVRVVRRIEHCRMAGAALTDDWALGAQNIALFGINILGVYRYLIRKKAPDG